MYIPLTATKKATRELGIYARKDPTKPLVNNLPGCAQTVIILNIIVVNIM